MHNAGAFVTNAAGQHRDRRYGRGGPDRPGSKNAAKPQDGSPRNLGGPASSVYRNRWKGDRQRHQPRPPARGRPAPAPGARGRQHEPRGNTRYRTAEQQAQGKRTRESWCLDSTVEVGEPCPSGSGGGKRGVAWTDPKEGNT